MTPHISITLLRTQSDERLVAMTADGHDRAFEAIVDRYRKPLLRYARRMLHEEARAEDVVQAGLVSAWAALREGVEVRDLRPWLYRIVHNGALNTMKRPTAEPLIEASDLRAGPDTVIERREDVRRAFDGIASLPERQRAALLAVAFEGRSHADVGEELGLQDGAVRQLVSRARTSLRTAATALTPYPLVLWLAHTGGPQTDEMGARIGELVTGAGLVAGAGAGAGTVLGGSAAVKAGAVIATAGVLAVGAPKVAHEIKRDSTPGPAAAQPVTAHQASGEGGSGAPTAQGVALRTVTVAGSGGRHASGGTRRHHRHRSGAHGAPTGSSGVSGSSGEDDGGHRGSSEASGREDVSSGSGEHHSGSSNSGSGERSGRRHAEDRSSSGGDTSNRSGSDDHASGGDDVAAAPQTSGSSGSSDDGSHSGSSGSSGSSGGSDDGSHSGSSDSSGSSGSTEPTSRERETETETETPTP